MATTQIVNYTKNAVNVAQTAAVLGIAPDEVIETVRAAFAPPASQMSTADFALSMIEGITADTIVRNIGLSAIATSIAAALRGKTGIWPLYLRLGDYPFPVLGVEEPQRLREAARPTRSSDDEVTEGLILVNLSHPLTPAQKAQLLAITGESDYTLVGVGQQGFEFHLDKTQPLGPQVVAFLDSLPLNGATWQAGNIIVNLPGFAEAAIAAAAYIEGLRGVAPRVIRTDQRKVGQDAAGKPQFEYDVTEVVDLQAIRLEAARAEAARFVTVERAALLEIIGALPEDPIAAKAMLLNLIG